MATEQRITAHPYPIIKRLLIEHRVEWYERDDGVIKVLSHLKHIDSGTWLTEVTRVDTISETLILLGY